MGTRYSGFQVQDNAPTVQGEVEKALRVLLRREVVCTGSSRTDAGVHAVRNYFHFDLEQDLPVGLVYRMNAILPSDISVRAVVPVRDDAHCRFDAVSRSYRYVLYREKDPFLVDRGWYYPFPLDTGLLADLAREVLLTVDFSSFAKRNTQVKTFRCTILESAWVDTEAGLEYHVKGNRFLRGMVRGLVGTMLQAGRGRMGLEGFREIIRRGDNRLSDFTPPGRGLYLMDVSYPDGYFAGPVGADIGH